MQACPLLNYKLSPAVLLEAVFTIVGAERALFSVADYFNTVALNTAGDQSATGGFCALHPERNIVFCRTSLICVASDRAPNTGMSHQVGRVIENRARSVRAEICLIVVEEEVPQTLLRCHFKAIVSGRCSHLRHE